MIVKNLIKIKGAQLQIGKCYSVFLRKHPTHTECRYILYQNNDMKLQIMLNENGIQKAFINEVYKTLDYIEVPKP